MAEISKQALIVENNQSFPNNNNGQITPSVLRSFNTDMIDSTVNQTVFNDYTASFDVSFNALEAFTASVAGTNAFTASYYVQSASFDSRIDSLENFSTSLDTNFASQAEFNSYTQSNDAKVDALIAFTSSVVSLSSLVPLNEATASLYAFTQSIDARVDSLESFSASMYLFTQSIQAEVDDIQAKTGSFATTGSNNFIGDQNINGNASITGSLNITGTLTANEIHTIIESSSVIFSSGSNILGDEVTDTQTLNGQVSVVGDLRVNGESISGSSYTSADFTGYNVTLTKGDGSTTQLNGFASTGSNAFIGVESISGNSGSAQGEVYLLGYSGSLVVGNFSQTPTYAALGHITSSQINTNSNLIFKTNTNTATTLLSGSANIFTNPAAPTAGFVRHIGGSHNLFLNSGSVPQVSGSMALSPSFNSNVISNASTAPITIRGPISGSAYAFNHNILMGGTFNLGTSTANSFDKGTAGFNGLGNALFNGSITANAPTTPLSSSVTVGGNLVFGAAVTLNLYSSSITYASNVQNGGIIVNNSFTPAAGTAVPALTPRVGVNTIYGIGHVLNISGTNTSTTIGKQFYANILAGSFLSASIGTGDNSQIVATGVIGNSLIITGSTLTSTFAGPDTANSGQGSLFAGRFNALDGSRAKTGETVFAIGTGTSNTNRKTGFLIDSGSNAFLEGTLTVSGSSTFSGSIVATGSIVSNVLALSIVSQTASIDFNAGNLFTLDLVSGSTTRLEAANIKAGQTLNLLISQPSVGTGSLDYSSTFKFPTGAGYVASNITGSKDILTFVTFDTTSVYASSVKNLV